MASPGSRSREIYAALRDEILQGKLPPTTKLPNQRELSATWHVSLSTMRQVLARLGAEGLIYGEPGRGTFVRGRVVPRVLLVADQPWSQKHLREYIAQRGHPVVEAVGSANALATLEHDPSIALVLADVRSPAPADVVQFIRTVRHRWPALPLAALARDIGDLAALRGSPEWPLLIVLKPFHPAQIDELLRFALPPP